MDDCGHSFFSTPEYVLFVVCRPSSLTSHIFEFSFEPLNGIQRNLTGSKISTSSTKFVLFGLIGRTRWPPWPLIACDIFDFSSETAEWNSTKVDRTQGLNVLYEVCVFWGRSEKQNGGPGLWLAVIFSTSPLKPSNVIQPNKTGRNISMLSMKFVFFGPIGKTRFAALASDLLRHFQFFLWNGWREFNETWPEVRPQGPLPIFVFLAKRKTKFTALVDCQQSWHIVLRCMNVALWAPCFGDWCVLSATFNSVTMGYLPTQDSCSC